MTYRDDHDAALARIDVLERELADAKADADRLRHARSERDRVPTRAAPPTIVLILIGFVIVLIALTLATLR